jgi:hypothetical protein
MAILSKSMNQNLYFMLASSKTIDRKLVCRKLIQATNKKILWVFGRLRDSNSFIEEGSKIEKQVNAKKKICLLLVRACLIRQAISLSIMH